MTEDFERVCCCTEEVAKGMDLSHEVKWYPEPVHRAVKWYLEPGQRAVRWYPGPGHLAVKSYRYTSSLSHLLDFPASLTFTQRERDHTGKREKNREAQQFCKEGAGSGIKANFLPCTHPTNVKITYELLHFPTHPWGATVKNTELLAKEKKACPLFLGLVCS